MRIVSFFALCAVTVNIGGCVLAITPLSRSGTHLTVGRDGQVIPTPEPPPATDIRSTGKHSAREQTYARYLKCMEGFTPVKDDNRPKIKGFTAAEVRNKDQLNQDLMNFIKQQDAYIKEHQKKEDQAYRDWQEHCGVKDAQ
jgi:hypothetical protein